MPANGANPTTPNPAELDAAERDLRRRIAANPADPAAHHNLGAVLLAARRLEESEAALRRATELDPGQKLSHHSHGIVLAELGRFDEAVDALRRAAAVDPEFLQAHWDLAGILNVAGRIDEAIAAIDMVLAARPDLAELRANRATLLSRSGRYEEAEQEFRRAISARPGLPEAHRGLGMAYRDLGRRDDAIAALHGALDLRPDWADALFTLAALVVDENASAEAEALFARALALDPSHWMAAFHLGVIADERGDARSAADYFARVSSDDPGGKDIIDSWSYFKAARTPATRRFTTGFELLADALAAARPDGLVLEFGVWHGASIRFLAGRTEGPVHGFDSFQGLPEAWAGEPAGSYSTGGVLPEVPANVTLHPGWFEETLPRFAAAHDGPVRFVNVDCDTYNSTKCILDHLAPRIGPGAVLVFDEYFMYPGWRDGEYKAWQEAVAANGWRYEYIAYNLSSRQVAVRVLGVSG